MIFIKIMERINRITALIKSKIFSMIEAGIVSDSGSLYIDFSIKGLVISFLPGKILPDEMPAKIDKNENHGLILVPVTPITRNFHLIDLTRT
jgi:hypothetical protein